MTNPTLAENLKRLRSECGLSATEVEQACGIRPPHLHALENGKIVNPKLDVIAKLSRCFGVSIAEVIAGDWHTPAELAVTFGMDAMRICIGMAPKTHSPQDVLRWVAAQAEELEKPLKKHALRHIVWEAGGPERERLIAQARTTRESNRS